MASIHEVGFYTQQFTARHAKVVRISTIIQYPKYPNHIDICDRGYQVKLRALDPLENTNHKDAPDWWVASKIRSQARTQFNCYRIVVGPEIQPDVGADHFLHSTKSCSRIYGRSKLSLLIMSQTLIHGLIVLSVLT